MNPVLDTPERLFSLSGGMLENLLRFPESCREAIDEAEKLPLTSLKGRDFKAVVVAGMGGSAIGGYLLSNWLSETCPIPIYVSRGYHLPAFVNSETLVLAVSYSGNTEETLTVLEEVLEKRYHVVTVTSDGEMKRISEENGLPNLSLPLGIQPRAALPNQFFSLATLINRLDLTAGSWVEVEEALDVLKSLREDLSPETPTSENPAKQLALAVKGFVPFIYGPRLFEAVAYRIGTQLNENSKIPAGSGFFPEVFHNVIMSREGPWEVRSRICTVLIRDPAGSLEVEKKVDAFKGLLETKVGRILEIQAQGKGKLSRMLSALYIGDYTATYLGLLHGINPSSSDSIAALKAA